MVDASMNLRSPMMKAIAWVSVLLCFCGWVIAMSGLSALQHDCGHYQLYKARMQRRFAIPGITADSLHCPLKHLACV